MARKVHWQYIYVVRNENGEEIAEVSTLEAALAMVGGNPSGGDAGCVMELNNGVRQVRESQNNSEESNRDPNLEPYQEEPRPSAESVIRIPRRRSSRRRRRTTLQFTLGQVEEMEKIFKETQYPDVLARKEIAGVLNIPEVKVKVKLVNFHKRWRLRCQNIVQAFSAYHLSLPKQEERITSEEGILQLMVKCQKEDFPLPSYHILN